jgi:hypothetical protein
MVKVNDKELYIGQKVKNTFFTAEQIDMYGDESIIRHIETNNELSVSLIIPKENMRKDLAEHDKGVKFYFDSLEQMVNKFEIVK